MANGRIISKDEFKTALEKVRGILPEGIEAMCGEYDKISETLGDVLPHVTRIGFFAGRSQRIEAFLRVCEKLDELINKNLMDHDGAIVAINVLRFSDKDFEKAMCAFVNFAHGKQLDGRHLGSFTAISFAQECC
jgi:hypothetical protein